MHGGRDDGAGVHWPAGFTPDCADYHIRAVVVVRACPVSVSGLLADVGRWPAWVPGVSETVPVSTTGVPGSFRFRLFGGWCECLIAEWLPGVRLGWSGLGPGLHFYHAWTFAEASGFTTVVSELAARGPTAVTMRDAHPEWENFLRYGWLEGLAAAAKS